MLVTPAALPCAPRRSLHALDAPPASAAGIMADSTACQYTGDCPSGEFAWDEQTLANSQAVLWTICGVVGALLTFPFLYILFNCDYVRSVWREKQNTEANQVKHAIREQTKRAARAEQSYGSVV